VIEMNFGIIVIGLMLVMASVLGIIMIASQNQAPYIDTFGAVQGNQTNDTQSIVTNTTSPLMAAGSGLALVLALFTIAVAGIVLVKFVTKNDTSGRR